MYSPAIKLAFRTGHRKIFRSMSKREIRRGGFCLAKQKNGSWILVLIASFRWKISVRFSGSSLLTCLKDCSVGNRRVTHPLVSALTGKDTSEWTGIVFRAREFCITRHDRSSVCVVHIKAMSEEVFGIILLLA